MSAFTNFAEELLLAWLFTTGTATRPTAWYVALHTDDPGETGASDEVLVGVDADYVRKVVTMAAPIADSGQSKNSTQVSWTAASTSTGYTITHISIWDALTGGNCLMKGILLVPKVQAADDIFTMEIGKIVSELD